MPMFGNGRNTALAVAVASRVPSGNRKRPSRCAVVCPMRSTWPRAMTRYRRGLKIAHRHLQGWHHQSEALRDAGGYPQGIGEHGAYETALHGAGRVGELGPGHECYLGPAPSHGKVDQLEAQMTCARGMSRGISQQRSDLLVGELHS